MDDAAQKQKQNEDALNKKDTELAAAQEKTASLTKQLEDTVQNLKEKEDALQRKEEELAAANRASGTPTPPTPDSVSTGVKVDTPSFATPMQATKLDLDADESEGDDWGDDWD